MTSNLGHFTAILMPGFEIGCDLLSVSGGGCDGPLCDLCISSINGRELDDEILLSVPLRDWIDGCPISNSISAELYSMGIYYDLIKTHM